MGVISEKLTQQCPEWSPPGYRLSLGEIKALYGSPHPGSLYRTSNIYPELEYEMDQKYINTTTN